MARPASVTSIVCSILWYSASLLALHSIAVGVALSIPLAWVSSKWRRMNEPSNFSRDSAASLDNVIMGAAPLSVVSRACSCELVSCYAPARSIAQLGPADQTSDDATG